MILNCDDIDIALIKDPKVKAVLICLFTDARATDDELPSHVQENRGWWGDGIEVSINDKKELISWGSLLWTLKRAKMSEDILTTVREQIKKALNPLVRSGYLAEPHITVSKEGDRLNFVLQFENETIDIRGVEL